MLRRLSLFAAAFMSKCAAHGLLAPLLEEYARESRSAEPDGAGL